MVLITPQQPMARDLRTLPASLGMCTELERIGDDAKGIATINLRSRGIGMPAISRQVLSMIEKAVDLLHREMTAYAEEDLQLVKVVTMEDDVINASYKSLYASA
jgi:phosphate transport system protein